MGSIWDSRGMTRPILQRTHCLCRAPAKSDIATLLSHLEEQDVSFFHPTFSLNLLVDSGLSLLFWSGLVVIHDTLCGIHSECNGTQNLKQCWYRYFFGVLHRWKAMDKGSEFWERLLHVYSKCVVKESYTYIWASSSLDEFSVLFCACSCPPPSIYLLAKVPNRWNIQLHRPLARFYIGAIFVWINCQLWCLDDL